MEIIAEKGNQKVLIFRVFKIVPIVYKAINSKGDAMKSTPKTNLDSVLNEYFNSSENFDAKILLRYLIDYPHYKDELLKYSVVQLSYQIPSREEVETEEVEANQFSIEAFLTKIKG